MSGKCAARVFRRVVDSRLLLQWCPDPSSSEMSSRSFSAMVRVGNVDHEDGKGVLAAGLDELLHERLLVSSGHLLVVELLGIMLSSYSRMELVVEEDGVQLVLECP
eukprot:6214783-Pleurochrysis_carterae.AAC.6